MIARILVATDFSPQSEEAIRRGVELAETLHAEVTLLHAWYAPVYALPDGSAIVPDAQAVADMSSRSYDQLQALRERFVKPGLKISAKVVEGPPAEAIVKVADGEKYDLLVLGTHGRTGVRRFLIGSVAEHVVRTAHTPVMTIHAAP